MFDEPTASPSPSASSPFDPIAPPPAPVPVTPVARPSRGARGGAALNGLLVVASLVAVGGIVFGIGRATAASPTATATGRFANGQGNAGGVAPNGSFAPGRGQFGQGGGFGGFGGAGASIALQGTVVSVTADTLTLKTTGGQTVEDPACDLDHVRDRDGQRRGRGDDRRERPRAAPGRRPRGVRRERQWRPGSPSQAARRRARVPRRAPVSRRARAPRRARAVHLERRRASTSDPR